MLKRFLSILIILWTVSSAIPHIDDDIGEAIFHQCKNHLNKNSTIQFMSMWWSMMIFSQLSKNTVKMEDFVLF